MHDARPPYIHIDHRHYNDPSIQNKISNPATRSSISPTQPTSYNRNHHPSQVHLVKNSTWNINYQASYDGSVQLYIQGNIDFLYYTELAAFIPIPNSYISATIISTANKTGDTLSIARHNHTYIRQVTIHTRLVSQ